MVIILNIPKPQAQYFFIADLHDSYLWRLVLWENFIKGRLFGSSHRRFSDMAIAEVIAILICLGGASAFLYMVYRNFIRKEK